MVRCDKQVSFRGEGGGEDTNCGAVRETVSAVCSPGPFSLPHALSLAHCLLAGPTSNILYLLVGESASLHWVVHDESRECTVEYL